MALFSRCSVASKIFNLHLLSFGILVEFFYITILGHGLLCSESPDCICCNSDHDEDWGSSKASESLHIHTVARQTAVSKIPLYSVVFPLAKDLFNTAITCPERHIWWIAVHEWFIRASSSSNQIDSHWRCTCSRTQLSLHEGLHPLNDRFWLA